MSVCHLFQDSYFGGSGRGRYLGYVDTIPGSFYAVTKIIPDRLFIHTKERLWRRRLCDGAKLRRADPESGASLIG